MIHNDNRIQIIFEGLTTIYISSTLTGDMNESVMSQSLQSHPENIMQLTMYEFNPEEDDFVGKIKAAFIYHLKRQPVNSSAVLNELFNNRKLNIHKELDNIIVQIAKDLAEDKPAADPRWGEQTSSCALGSSMSMQIQQQLKEKNRAYVRFIEFLHASELWEKVYRRNFLELIHDLNFGKNSFSSKQWKIMMLSSLLATSYRI